MTHAATTSEPKPTQRVLTLHLRIKDRKAVVRMLQTQAVAVNQVWNFCNELSVKHLARKRAFMSAYDMQPYTKGAGKELGLHSQTVQAVQEEYVVRRRQFKKPKLRWRASSGPKRALGWIPFKAGALVRKGTHLVFGGQQLKLWDSFALEHYTLGSGSLSEDSQGRWFLNVTVKAPLMCGPRQLDLTRSVGLDLGLKDFLAASDGFKVQAQRIYRKAEVQLATAQRANKKKRVRAIHTKIKNVRKDFHHKLSTALVAEYGLIVVGNVNASGLAKTNMAKSVLDAGWSAFRGMLQYKGDYAGTQVKIVNEAFTTQTCSACDARSGPRGLKGLGIREWLCSECGTVHDRDTNAARVILARGLTGLVAGAPVRAGTESPALQAGE